MSFQQGLSGLNASSKALEVIGNNIANANTYGAKGARAEFQDVYAAALNGATTSGTGIGVQVAAVAQQFTQGAISITENPMDLAINGAGFFELKDPIGQLAYTRNGQFKVDKNGFVVNNAGLKLQDPNTKADLKVDTAGADPVATVTANMAISLDSRAKPTSNASLKNPADPNSGMQNDLPPTLNLNNPKFNNSTSLTVYDKDGQTVPVTLYFQKAYPDDDAPNVTTWNVFAVANGTPVTINNKGEDGGAVDMTKVPVFTQIKFDPSKSGAIFEKSSVASLEDGIMNLKIPAVKTAGTGNQSIPPVEADYLDPTKPGIALDLKKISQFASQFAVSDISQNGYARGDFLGVSIQKNGDITARYSNGTSKVTGQIGLVNFRNPQALQAMGGNIWSAPPAAGDRTPGTPGVNTLGSLQSGALEESNVDLTAELVNMVTAQRIYQANSQTIKTMDQVLQTLVNLR